MRLNYDRQAGDVTGELNQRLRRHARKFATTFGHGDREEQGNLTAREATDRSEPMLVYFKPDAANKLMAF